MTIKTPRLMTTSELLSGYRSVDNGVTMGFKHYLYLGFEPGSFGVACLLGDYELAYKRAHFKLRETAGKADDIIATMVSLALSLPSNITGTMKAINNWSQIGGLLEAPTTDKVLTKLSWNQEIWGSYPTTRDEIWNRTR